MQHRNGPVLLLLAPEALAALSTMLVASVSGETVLELLELLFDLGEPRSKGRSFVFSILCCCLVGLVHECDSCDVLTPGDENIPVKAGYDPAFEALSFI